jgi:hypothetical protein
MRKEMKDEALIHCEGRFSPWLTFIAALTPLLIGVAAIVRMSLQVDPFG